MSLGRAWWRHLGRASGAAVLAPAAMIAAVAVLSLAGGFGGLRSIGQAISGPVPPVQAQTGGLPRSEHATARLVALVGARTSGRGAPSGAGRLAAFRAGGSSGSGASGTGLGTGGGAGPGRSGTPGAATPHAPIGQAPASPHGTPAPGSQAPAPTSPAPPPPPSQGPVPSAIDHVVSTTAGVTQKLPSPVGPVATHTVDQLGKTIDGIIGSTPPRAVL